MQVRTHRYQFNLRALLLTVGVIGVVAGIWTQRERWWVHQLAKGDNSAIAWVRLLQFNGLPHRHVSDLALDVWAQRSGTVSPGWVWVRDDGIVKWVTPAGKVQSGGIYLPGSNTEIIWNGMLTEDGPAIAIFNSVHSEASYLSCLSVRTDSAPVGEFDPSRRNCFFGP